MNHLRHLRCMNRAKRLIAGAYFVCECVQVSETPGYVQEPGVSKFQWRTPDGIYPYFTILRSCTKLASGTVPRMQTARFRFRRQRLRRKPVGPCRSDASLREAVLMATNRTLTLVFGGHTKILSSGNKLIGTSTSIEITLGAINSGG